MNTGTLIGKCAIIVARCSSQHPTASVTIDRQIEVIKNYCAREGIIVVEEIRHGEWATERRHELALRQLILRKKTRNDFDLIVVMDYDRLSRERRTAMWLWNVFYDTGVEVVSATQIRLDPMSFIISSDPDFFQLKARCISFARSATVESLHSIKGQQAAIRAFATKKHLVIVDEIAAAGERNPVPLLVETLIARKKTANDFDVLLVKSPDRLGRNSSLFRKVQVKLVCAGIEVRSVDLAVGLFDNFTKRITPDT